jgi:flagellar protein FliO/FliZ
MVSEFGLMDWLSMMGSFLLVIGLLMATLFFIKKMGPGISNAANKRMQIIEIQNLGGRQKLLLVRVNSDQVLIGISPQGMTSLGSWPLDKQQQEQINEQGIEGSQEHTGSNPVENFKQLLTKTIKKQKD